LRYRLWTHASASVGAFCGTHEAVLPVLCTYDLNVASAKYLHALEAGEVPLLFLFSGSVFWRGPDGGLAVQPISWDKECSYSMPVPVWRDLMERMFPNSAWLDLRRDIFERLCDFKRRNALPTWDHVIERLLALDSAPANARRTSERAVVELRA
jgi:hypothetical protein